MSDAQSTLAAFCVIGILVTLYLCRRAARTLADKDLPYLNPRRRSE